MIPTLVMKFGGASVQSPEHIRSAAALVARRRQKYSRLVVVVSAMGETTDQLFFLARAMQKNPLPREQDMLISVGERVTMSLLAMALCDQGIEAVSFTGSQSGIITNEEHTGAKILSVQPGRILNALSQNKVVIVAGFQGVSTKGEITTLGRGGSDTTAVALGAALDAERVEFYKDVAGIYPLHPKKEKRQVPFPELTYAKALEIVAGGAEVLDDRALRLAQKNAIPLLVRSFAVTEEGGTFVKGEAAPTGRPVFEGNYVKAGAIRRGIQGDLAHLYRNETLPKIFTEEGRLIIATPHTKHGARFLQEMVPNSLFFHAILNEKVDYFELAAEGPVVEDDLLQGLASAHRANQILEMRGGDKTALTRERIHLLSRRFPLVFDFDLIGEVEHFFALTKETFQLARFAAHQAQIIYTLYFLRKQLEGKIVDRGKRYIVCKLRRHNISTPFGIKEVVGIYLYLNFLKEHELFEERHLLSAISRLIPAIQSTSGSFYCIEGRDEEIQGVYLEVEKEEEALFTKEDFALLLEKLPGEITARIEQLVPPVFMPRNEEEVLQGIITLAGQIKYVKDIPQMIISFEEQTGNELLFTIILVRVLNENSLPLQKLFPHFSFDRVRMVGMVRRKYPKEGAVMRAALPVSEYFRDDYSVDLSAARQGIVEEIEAAFGQVRDFNGGMIAKQRENYTKMISFLQGRKEIDLQNYFYAIHPAPLSATVAPELLADLFEMQEKAKSSVESISLQSKKNQGHLLVMIKVQEFEQRQKIFHKIESLSIPSSQLLSIQMQIFDAFFLGFIYLSGERERQKAFLQTIPEAFVCTTYG